MQRDLGNVAGLIGDALNVGDHLERGGHLAQIARDRLLAQEQRQAAVLDFMLGRVDLAVPRNDAARQLHIAGAQGGHGALDRAARRMAHPGQHRVQLQQLGIVHLPYTCTHIAILLNRSGPRYNPRCAYPQA